MTFWYSKPGHLDAQTVITAGIQKSDVRPFFADIKRVDAVQAVEGVHSEELGHPILLCRQPLVSLDDVWPLARRFY